MLNLSKYSNNLLGLYESIISREGLAELKKQNANLAAIADIYDNRSFGAHSAFYDLLDGTNDYSKGIIDNTRTKLTTAAAAGTTVLTGLVTNPAGFKTGQEITIQDATKIERKMVTRGETISNSIVYDKTTPVNVVANAQLPNANARPQRLSNGWFVAATINPVATPKSVQISVDKGSGFVPLCNIQSSGSNNYEYCSISCKDTIIYVLATNQNGTTDSTTILATFDATTVTNVNINNTHKVTLQTSLYISNCSLIINSAATELYATWNAKITSHLNSFNLFYCKGVINANGTVTWGGVEQVTLYNQGGYDMYTPVMLLDKNNIPTIVFVLRDFSNYSIQLVKKSNELPLTTIVNTGWTRQIISPANGYIQANPQVIVDNNGVINVFWQGRTVSYANKDNLHYSKSTDAGIGVTWSTMLALTNSNTNDSYAPSPTIDKNNNLYVVYVYYQDASNSLIRYFKYDTQWNPFVTITTSGINLNPSTMLYGDIERPITLFKDATSVKFYGKWIETTVEHHLEVAPLQNAFGIGALVYRSNVEIVGGVMKIGDINTQNSNYYNNGVENISVGIGYSFGTGSQTKQPTYLELIGSASSARRTYNFLADLTNIAKLYVDWECSAANAYLFVSTDQNAVQGATAADRIERTANFSRTTQFLDVSAKTGSHYVGVQANSVSSNNLKVYRIWGEDAAGNILGPIKFLTADIRYNIIPALPANIFSAWIQREEGLNLEGFMSIGENESYMTMTKTTGDSGSFKEDSFDINTGAKGSKATLKLVATRADTTIDKGITKVLGAIA